MDLLHTEQLKNHFGQFYFTLKKIGIIRKMLFLLLALRKEFPHVCTVLYYCWSDRKQLKADKTNRGSKEDIK